MKKGIINRVTDSKGKDKQSQFLGMNIEFSENIEIGRSLVMIIDNYDDYIETSKVINVKIVDGDYVISTKNSVYYINVKGDK